MTATTSKERQRLFRARREAAEADLVEVWIGEDLAFVSQETADALRRLLPRASSPETP
jgi:hypothetical protein